MTSDQGAPRLYPCECGCEVMFFADAESVLGRREVDPERLSYLAHCLRDAGALCAAWSKGYTYGYECCPCDGYYSAEDYEQIDADYWHPGCGRPVRGGL